MERYIKARDYKILIYDKEDRESYRAAINALTEAKKMSGWDRVQGVTIHKDCRICRWDVMTGNSADYGGSVCSSLYHWRGTYRQCKYWT